jgi:hypothetical protein
MTLFAALGVITAPTALANDILGVAESRASWTNPSTGTVHTFHWRFAVERDVSTSPDRFRYRARTWCDYRLAGSSTVVAERCNFNMFDSWLLLKDCAPDVWCAPRAPWGSASWEADNVTEKLWLGGWHQPTGLFSVMAVTDFMQARFLIPNHVTNWYHGCSHWVGPDGQHAPDPTSCAS